MDRQEGQKLKIFKTIGLIFSWICMGLYSEVSSPTLPTLKERVKSDYEEISRALVARSVGFLLGSLVAGFIGTKWKHLNYLWISLSLFMAGGATIAAPWCSSLTLLSVMFFLDGFAKGILAVCTSSAVMDLWKEKAAVPTHSLHFSFGLGALIAPQVARPFIPAKRHSKSNSTVTDHFNTTNMYTTPFPNMTDSLNDLDHPTDDRIEIVYGIMGAITLLCACLFIYFHLVTKPEPRRIDQSTNEGTPKKKCFKFLAKCMEHFSGTLVVLYIILFIFWCLPVGAERAYGKFLFAFAVESKIQMDPGSATMLESMFWATFTAGRGIATIAAKWTPPQILLAVEIAIKIICAFILAFFANQNAIVLWVVTGFFAATISPIFPACLIWTNQYVEMTAGMNAFAFLSSAFGAFVFSWGTGYLFEYKGPVYLMYVMLGYAICSVIVYLALFLFYKYSSLQVRDSRRVGVEPQEELETLKE